MINLELREFEKPAPSARDVYVFPTAGGKYGAQPMVSLAVVPEAAIRAGVTHPPAPATASYGGAPRPKKFHFAMLYTRDGRN